MDPEQLKLAQEMMGKMSPAQLAEMQRAAASIPPSVLQKQSEMLKTMSAEQMKQAMDMMASARPEEVAAQVRAATAAVSGRARYVLSASTQLKQEGNSLFKAGKHAEALAKYERAISNVDSPEIKAGDASVKAEASALKKACLLNSAAAALSARSWAKSIEAASAALAEEPGSAKALFRRGMARAGEAREGGSGGAASSSRCDDDVVDREKLAAAAADLKAAATASKGTADEATILEKLSEVERELKGGEESSSAAAAAAVEAAASRAKAEDDKRRADKEKKEREEEEKAAQAAAALNPFAGGGLGGGRLGAGSAAAGGGGGVTPDPAQLRAMASAMRSDPTLASKMASAAKNMTPDQLKAAAAAQGLPEEAQSALGPDALSAAGEAMSSMTPDDLERMADAVEAASNPSPAGSSAISGLFGGGPSSSLSPPADPAAAAAAMLKDPAALRQATAMVKGLRPEQLAALSGGKIDAASAEKLARSLEGMSDEKIAAMLSASAKFADWIRKLKEAKERYCFVFLAVAVLVVAVVLRRLGWF